jgi:hypothetical protein
MGLIRMMNTLRKLAIAIAVIGIASFRSLAPADAAVLYDNLSFASGGSDPAIDLLYDSFSTGPGGFSVSRIGLLLTAPTADAGTFTINVFSGQNFPSAVLFSAGTFSDGLLSTTLSKFYVNFSPESLAASTRYWVELSTTGSVEWGFDADASGIGVAGEFFQNQNGVFSNSNGPYQMQLSDVQVSAVPEASSWAMMILGFVGLAFAARLRARRVANREQIVVMA